MQTEAHQSRSLLCFSVSIDRQGDFRWEFDPNIIYDLIYADGEKRLSYHPHPHPHFLVSRNRTPPLSGTRKAKIWSWLGLVGSR
jgi:hypothetical protein